MSAVGASAVGATSAVRPRRRDPMRSERIIEACLDVIVAEGVDGLSHRKVAAAADVPLGSMTYHFAGRDALLMAAFEKFARRASERLDAAMARAASPEEARAAIERHVLGVVLIDDREVVLMTELYALAARDERYKAVTHAWMARSRAALERHFDPATARILDALIEGLALHRSLDDGSGEGADVARAIALLSAD